MRHRYVNEKTIYSESDSNNNERKKQKETIHTSKIHLTDTDEEITDLIADVCCISFF
jgi:hypothetical protein